jgi:hypothetical protein
MDMAAIRQLQRHLEAERLHSHPSLWIWVLESSRGDVKLGLTLPLPLPSTPICRPSHTIVWDNPAINLYRLSFLFKIARSRAITVMLIHASFGLARTTLKDDNAPKLHFSWKHELSKFAFQYEILGEMVWIGSIDKRLQVSVVIDGVDPEG